MKKKHQALSMLLCMTLVLGLLTIAVPATAQHNGLDNFSSQKNYGADTFADVGSSDWFYSDVKAAYQYGLMVGSSEKKFNPNGNITIAETIAVAARLHSVYYSQDHDFKQGSVWYQTYVDYASKNGIISDAALNYNKSAGRADFAKIIAAAFPAEALPAINQIQDNAIPDVEQAKEYGPSVYMLYRAGILTGNDTYGTFHPDSNIKRSEVAAIITRMINPNERAHLDFSAKTDGSKPDDAVQNSDGAAGNAQSTEPTFYVQTVEATPGQEKVSVSVLIKNNPGVSAISLTLSYGGGISLDSIVYNKDIGGETMLPQTMGNPIKLLWLNPFKEVTTDFTLATLYFNVKKTAAQGNQQISISYNPDDVYNLAENNVHFAVSSGAIVIK